MTEITLMSDPRVPVAAADPFTDLRTVSELVIDDRLADPCGAFAHVRAGVATQLLAAQSRLRGGLRLRVVEAYRVLTEARLVNYPTEWWHWSYGDRYWALRTGRPAALYRQHDMIPGQGEDGDDAR